MPPTPRLALCLLLVQATVVALVTVGCSGRGAALTLPTPLPPPGLVADIAFLSARPPHHIAAVVRATEAESEVGLMYRKERLTDDEGMLFAFGEDKDHSFWMKNTFISLDLIYLDATGKIVGIIADVPPLSLDSRAVGQPSRFVLEVQAGFCARHGLEVGHVLAITMKQASSV